MTDLAALADFIASPYGRMYGRYCERYGLHPGDIFSDDVVKFQVGMAYMLREYLVAKEPTQPAPDKDGFLSEDFWKQEQ